MFLLIAPVVALCLAFAGLTFQLLRIIPQHQSPPPCSLRSISDGQNNHRSLEASAQASARATSGSSDGRAEHTASPGDKRSTTPKYSTAQPSHESRSLRSAADGSPPPTHDGATSLPSVMSHGSSASAPTTPAQTSSSSSGQDGGPVTFEASTTVSGVNASTALPAALAADADGAAASPPHRAVAATAPAASGLVSLNVGGTMFTVRRQVLVQSVPVWEPSPPPPPSLPPLPPPPASPPWIPHPAPALEARPTPSTDPALAVAAAAARAPMPRTDHPQPPPAAPVSSSSASGCARLRPTLLCAMFSGRWEAGLPRDDLGRPFLELDPTCFKQLVNWMVTLHRVRELLPPPPTLGTAATERQEGASSGDGDGGGDGDGDGETLLLALAAAGAPPAPAPPSDGSLLTAHLEMLRYLGLPLPYVPPPPRPPPVAAAPSLPLTRVLGPTAFRMWVDRAVWVHGCKRACLELPDWILRSREGSIVGSGSGPGLGFWIEAAAATASGNGDGRPAAGAAAEAGVGDTGSSGSGVGMGVFRLMGHEEVVRGSGGAWVLAPFRVVPYGKDVRIGMHPAPGGAPEAEAGGDGDGEASGGGGGGGSCNSHCWRCGAVQLLARAEDPAPDGGGHGATGQGMASASSAAQGQGIGSGGAEAAPAGTAAAATAVATGRYLVSKLRLSTGTALGVLLGPVAEVAARCGKYGVTSPAEHGAFFGWDSAAELPAPPPPAPPPAPQAAAAAGSASPPRSPVGLGGSRWPVGMPLRAVGGGGGGIGGDGGGAADDGGIGYGSPPAPPVIVGAATICGNAPPTPLSMPPLPPLYGALGGGGASAASAASPLPLGTQPTAAGANIPLYDMQRDVVLGLDTATSRLSLSGGGGGGGGRHRRLLSLALPDGCGEGAVAVFLRGRGQAAEVLGREVLGASDCRAVRVAEGELL